MADDFDYHEERTDEGRTNEEEEVIYPRTF
jgi:hypothetical protein